MVRFSSPLFVLALAVSSFASPTFKRAVPQVNADIVMITTKVDALDEAINSFKGDLKAALDIHMRAKDLAEAVGNGASAIMKSGRFSESDSHSVMALVQPLAPKIVATLRDITAKKAAFVGMPIGGIPALIKMDLNELNSETNAFEKALIVAVAPDDMPKVKSIKADNDAAFAQAIGAYA